MFRVKEIFYSLQGEGHYSGTPCVFCRFVGCNLWSGKEADKRNSVCWFCDTDFLGGAKYSENDLVEAICSMWPGGGRPRVVFTGGEPSLQLTKSLIERLRKKHFNMAVETNGENPLPNSPPFWVTVSPKTANFKVRKGHEAKLLWPEFKGLIAACEESDFDFLFVQPVDDKNYEENLRSATNFVLHNPRWRLSLQTHKILGIR